MYKDFFGFSQNPFELTPDPHFLFLTPYHQEALSAMIYGISQSKGFVMITGEVGTGKTTLIHALIEKLPENIKTVVIFHSKLTFTDLLRTILQKLDQTVNTRDRVTLLHQLNLYLIDQLARGHSCAVIIDEAHNLSEDVLEDLRMLSNIETGQQKLLQLILVGQPELDEKLSQPSLRQLRQRIGLFSHLKPLNKTQSRQYMEYRLAKVGADLEAIFSQHAIELIFDVGQGIPRLINIISDNALLTAYSRQERKISASIIREVVEDIAPEVKIKKKADLIKVETRSWYYKPAVVVTSVLLILLIYSFLKINNSAVNKKNMAEISETGKNYSVNETSKEPLPVPVKENTSIIPDTYEDSSEDRPKNSNLLDENNDLEVNHLENIDVTKTKEVKVKETNSFRKIVIQPGDTLSKLIIREYGRSDDEYLQQVLALNSELSNPDLIIPGQTLLFPEVEELSQNYQVIKLKDGKYALKYIKKAENSSHEEVFKDSSDLLKISASQGLSVSFLPSLKETTSSELGNNKSEMNSLELMISPFENFQEALKWAKSNQKFFSK